MASILALLLIAGLFLYLIWYLFFRSVLWVAEPLIKHFEDRQAERFTAEEDSGVKAKKNPRDCQKLTYGFTETTSSLPNPQKKN